MPHILDQHERRGLAFGFQQADLSKRFVREQNPRLPLDGFNTVGKKGGQRATTSRTALASRSGS
ncbi:hypothetical protein [Halochromatium salexigens]|uniref:Uncharacterized protein n=1 Tax=Halochromatium salexigens TaxID=49447 RepID=A0AAJ0XG78_HALSE|nr:hypothetical protein [Halochromatium salexigens]MBK5930437.1 hypothetical protein [Halochromatium salexigens]